MQNKQLTQFIDNLISQRGYTDVSEAVHKELQRDLNQRLDEFVMTAAVSALSAEDLIAFEKLLDEQHSPEELKQFVKEHISDYTTFMTSTLLTFQDAYLS